MAPTARAPAVTAHLRCKRRVVRWEWALETAHCERMAEEREGGGKRGKAASIPQFLMPLRTNVLYNVVKYFASASGPEPLLLVVPQPRHARVSWRRWSSTCRSHCYQSPAPPTFRRRAFRCVLAPFELPAQSEEQIRHYQYSPCSIARNACRHCVPQPTKNRIHLVRAGRLHSILLRPLTSTLWTMKYLSQWHERSTTFTYTRRAPPGTTALPTQASACVV